MRGWQNIALERHRIKGRENAVSAIRQVYPTAIEVQVGDEYAYLLDPDTNPSLVGIIWKVDGSDVSYWYASMSPIAQEAGVSCAIIRYDAGNRIIPGVPGVNGVMTPEQLDAAIHAPVAALRAEVGKQDPIVKEIVDKMYKTEPDPFVDNAITMPRRRGRPPRQPVVTVVEKPSPPRRGRPPRQPLQVHREIYHENGGWYALIETPKTVHELGPFNSKREALQAEA